MARKRQDLTGITFDRLTVIGPADDYVNPKSGQHFSQWLCQCSCGKQCVKRTSYLLSKTTPHKSCGCYRSDSNKGRNLVNLTGRRFGRLTVVSRADDKYEPSGKAIVMWHCRCDCGNELDVRAATLVNGSTTSCGCAKSVMTKDFRDLTGRHFGRWTVLKLGQPQHRGKRTYRTWTCRCECGTVRDVSEQSLVKGVSRSCGCLRNERLAERVTNNPNERSLAETYTIQYLERRSIPYEYQKTFSDLKSRSNRGADPSYDFLVHLQPNLDILMDLWGAEHLRQATGWDDEQGFNHRREVDLKKRTYAIKHHFVYLAINTSKVSEPSEMIRLLDSYLNPYVLLFNCQGPLEDVDDVSTLL